MEPDAAEIRVLGCLIEKQRTTPDVYPLSLNALRIACNQSTNRDPVVSYEEETVVEALRRLALRGWTRLASNVRQQGAQVPPPARRGPRHRRPPELAARGVDAARRADAGGAEAAHRAPPSLRRPRRGPRDARAADRARRRRAASSGSRARRRSATDSCSGAMRLSPRPPNPRPQPPSPRPKRTRGRRRLRLPPPPQSRRPGRRALRDDRARGGGTARAGHLPSRGAGRIATRCNALALSQATYALHQQEGLQATDAADDQPGAEPEAEDDLVAARSRPLSQAPIASSTRPEPRGASAVSGGAERGRRRA